MPSDNYSVLLFICAVWWWMLYLFTFRMKNTEFNRELDRMVLCDLRRRKMAAAETHRKIVELEVDKAPKYVCVLKWLKRFDNGEDEVKDRTRSGRPQSVDRSRIEQAV